MLWCASPGLSMPTIAAVSGVSIISPSAPFGDTASGFQWLSW